MGGAAGCLHGIRDMLVMAFASGIPGAISFIIGILYMHFSGGRHRATGGGTRYEPAKGQKLMLVEVEDGPGGQQVRGTPLNPDILMTGNSAMASYNSASYPRQININTTAMDLSSFQSGNQSYMSTIRPGEQGLDVSTRGPGGE